MMHEIKQDSGGVQTMENKVREWAAELFRLCDQVSRGSTGDVDFQISSSADCAYCSVLIYRNGDVKSNYRLYLDPELWELTAFNFRKAKERLNLILHKRSEQIVHRDERRIRSPYLDYTFLRQYDCFGIRDMAGSCGERSGEGKGARRQV